MRCVVQRVAEARVVVGGEVVGEVGRGLLALEGVSRDDREVDGHALADKLVNLRIFPDEEGKMNRSVLDEEGEVLLVSQFTLLGDVSGGRRPSFIAAARPEGAEPLVEQVGERIRSAGVPCATGRFGAEMSVQLVNEGPVTIVIDVVDGKAV